MKYLFLLLLSTWLAHDIHLTKSQVDYDASEKTFQVSLHVFLDDLEAELKERTDFSGNLNMGTEKEMSFADSLLVAYLRDHFVITNGVDTLPIAYLGKENSEDLLAIWCFFEFPVADLANEISVSNTILISRYADQQNIVSFTGPDRHKKFLLLNKNDHYKQFSY